MLRLVRNLALGAALLTVAVAVWRDYGVLITLRRAITAYLVVFFLAGGLGLIGMIGLRVNQPPPPPDDEGSQRRGQSARKAKEAASAGPPPTDASPDASPVTGEPSEPESGPGATTVES
jgi:hypothetical protein